MKKRLGLAHSGDRGMLRDDRRVERSGARRPPATVQERQSELAAPIESLAFGAIGSGEYAAEHAARSAEHAARSAEHAAGSAEHAAGPTEQAARPAAEHPDV